ncbi:FecCD family ABC transporter permease [Nocardia sp. IBHARD005]|uniref:FecCD family ABC transporter permease n=1 Tax=Nocardia sp. IBHARD005 TaxID=3457765 RepID=UPI004059EBF5
MATSAKQATSAPGSCVRATSKGMVWVWLTAAIATVVVLGLSLGTYAVSPVQVAQILGSTFLPIDQTWPGAAATVVLDVRLPRLVLGLLVGAALAVGGVVLQAVFRNPIVNPQIIGVSSGASFGGVLAIVLGAGAVLLIGSAFVFGMLALVVVFAVSRTRGATPTLGLVLSGVVVGAFFAALVSFVIYLADPYSELQSIVFWLLGSLATATSQKVGLAAGPVLVGLALLVALRWRLNVLSLGDDDAQTLGVNPVRLRWGLLTIVGAMVASAVAVAGVIGWVGLVVPHLARIWVGPDHRILVPVCAVLGAVYLTAIDTLTRAVVPGEIPIGVLTAIIGAPLFLILLRRSQTRAWADA